MHSALYGCRIVKIGSFIFEIARCFVILNCCFCLLCFVRECFLIGICNEFSWLSRKLLGVSLIVFPNDNIMPVIF